MLTALTPILNVYHFAISQLVTFVNPVINILARSYVAWVFFASGLTKIRDWESTLMLFEYEYSVPLLDFKVAAYLATFGELVLPVLLVLGIATRFNAIGLSIVNIVAVISLEEIAPAALNGHIIWAVVLLHIILVGADKISFDHWFKKVLLRRDNLA